MYTYDASDKKLEVINYSVRDIINVPIGTISTLPDPSRYTKLTTDYVGNMIYENGSLKEILLPEGYYKNGTYYYYLKDHLGNTRVVVNNAGSIVEKSHYYPSGTRFFPESTSNSDALAYRYNGKEMESMNGLNQMDYGARRRYSGLPIWTGPDELREKYYSISPYAYCLGNPVKFIDPTGMKVETGSMTKDEQKEYDKMIALLSRSDLFKTLYSTLVKSDNVYTISFGQTDKDKSGNALPGNFKPDSKTDGGSITFLKGNQLNGLSTTEELAHAYQNENKTLENPNVNPEFEAKTITQLVGEDVAGYRYYDGMTNFQRYLESEYHNILTPKSVSSSKFQSNYQNAAILYSAYNQANNLGNFHYRQLTLQQPATLMKLVNNTFLKNMPWIK